VQRTAVSVPSTVANRLSGGYGNECDAGHAEKAFDPTVRTLLYQDVFDHLHSRQTLLCYRSNLTRLAHPSLSHLGVTFIDSGIPNTETWKNIDHDIVTCAMETDPIPASQ
jgi:hypothetical protein